jgi:SAM-dependent methyltransferase
MMIPKILNLGSGKDFREECINLDENVEWLPDIVCDFGKPLKEEGFKVYRTARFGDVKLEKGTFEKIIANDVLEHIPDLKTCMTNCLDLLKEGGVMEIIVPYDTSLGAWQDPTHVRAFNQNSWLYFTEWSWYLGWKREKFLLEQLDFGLSAFGKKVEEQGMKLEELINMPRAVDRMRVTLKKIITQVETKGGQNG